MSVLAILITGFSVTISYKIKSNLEFKFTLSGDDIMKLIMATSMLADITGICGDCNSLLCLRSLSYIEIR